MLGVTGAYKDHVARNRQLGQRNPDKEKRRICVRGGCQSGFNKDANREEQPTILTSGASKLLKLNREKYRMCFRE